MTVTENSSHSSDAVSAPLSELGQAAVEYASSGNRVFPLVALAKRPMLAKWEQRASNDPAVVEGWWRRYPDANIGWVPDLSGHFILDVDVKHAAPGPASLDAYEMAAGALPETLTIGTPTGGEHRVFRGRVASSVDRKAGLDFRGGRGDGQGLGYGVLPPSVTVDGAYSIKHQHEPAEAPPELIAMANRSRASSPTSGPTVPLDLPVNLQGFREHMRRQPPAPEGERNDTASTYVGWAGDYAVSKETALPILFEWADRCSPPMDHDEIEGHGLWLRRQNTGAPMAQESDVVETFGAVVAEMALAAEPASEPDDYPPSLSARELAEGTYPPPVYLIEKTLREHEVNLIVGDGKVGKTYAVLHMAVAVAAGIDLWGLKCRQAAVLLVLHEDDTGETKQRVERICAARGVALTDLPITFWCLPGYDTILADVSDRGEVSPGPFLKRLLGKLVETRAKFLALDPLSDFANLDETKRLAANAYCKKVLGPIARRMSVTIAQTAHPSKTSMADGSFVSGSTGWKNAVRNVIVMERLKDAPKSNPKRLLHTAWTNAGPDDELDLELAFAGGVLYQTDGLPDATEAAAREALIQAVIKVAVKAAETGKPLNGNTKKLLPEQLAMIEADTGKRPTGDEVKELLKAAVWRGLLHQLDRNRHRSAGFYPPDQRAIELAIAAKHAAKDAAVKLGFMPPNAEARVS